MWLVSSKVINKISICFEIICSSLRESISSDLCRYNEIYYSPKNLSFLRKSKRLIITNIGLDLIVSQAPTDLGNFVTVVSRFAGTIKGVPPGFDEIPFFPGIPVEDIEGKRLDSNPIKVFERIIRLVECFIFKWRSRHILTCTMTCKRCLPSLPK